ncbi:sulfotransferase [Methanocalculus alkaliphilus]|uniref:sulfotransferase n=1 Tax=Methanocalculus alkaliphilus TaxID=768730 RepID=UPI0020A2030D|nr:sulfotransferase [Methanocalculus alkaliphilus]
MIEMCLHSNEDKLINIIVLGSNKSGSSAVFDYLAGRADIADPLQGQELSIMQNPYGILSFISAVYESYYPTIGAELLDKLEWMLYRAGYPRRGYTCGYGLKNIIPDYNHKVKKYINEITDIQYPFAYQHYMLNASKLRILKTIILESILKNKITTCQRIPVSKEQFITITKDFLLSLLEHRIYVSDTIRGVIINQAGSYWCPEKSLDLFHNPRLIVVSRDPRDQFAELKVKKGLTDVKTFVSWYKSIMALKSINYGCTNYNTNIIYIQFEDFVLKHEQERERLCSFLGIETDVISTFQPGISAKNIGKYHRELSVAEYKYIEKHLESYIVNRGNF